MALSFLNRCGFRATSTGTGSFVVASALTGMQTPAQAAGPAVVDGATYRYFAQSDDQTQWEYGYGVYTSGDTTLTRATVLDNSSGGTTALSFSAAPKVFMGGPLAQDVETASNRYMNLNSAGMFMSFDASDDAQLEQCTLQTNDFESIDFSGCIGLIFFQASHNTSCTTVDISNCPKLLYALMDDCALDETSVDHVLTTLDANGLSDGSIDVSQGTNAVPSSTGLTAKTNLEGKGWSVTVNV